MTSITDFLLDAANAEPCDLPLRGLAHAAEGPLCRMLRGEPVLPTSPHYDSLATGIASLLGTVDPRLIQIAMAERASGQHILH